MIIAYEQLKEQIGGNSPAEVAARLDRLGIKYLIGKQNRPFTTEFALNAAMGLTSTTFEQQEHQPVVEVG